jgi:ABC-type uncharacterized transport system auxiliary subunit
MNAHPSTARNLLLAVAVVAALAGCAAGPWNPPPDVAQRIATASTRADHEWLADYYREEIGKARQAAEQHRRMARAYRSESPYARGTNWQSHCESLIRTSEAMAAEYERMAAGHRQLAAEAKP